MDAETDAWIQKLQGGLEKEAVSKLLQSMSYNLVSSAFLAHSIRMSARAFGYDISFFRGWAIVNAARLIIALGIADARIPKKYIMSDADTQVITAMLVRKLKLNA